MCHLKVQSTGYDISSSSSENTGLALHLWVYHLKVQSTGYGISSSSSENSGLHCTFGCATLKYSLQAMILVAAQVKILGYTAPLGVPP